MRNLAILLLLLFGVHSVFSQEAMSRLYQSARQMEVRPMPEKPGWAEPSSPPLFRVAWLSDLHITDSDSEKLVRSACDLLRNELHPDLVFITGDNCGLPEELLPASPETSLALRRQRWLKAFLEKEMPFPTTVIPGDNWPWEFDQVFGAEKRCFEYAGFQFIFVTQDQQAAGREGCLVFAEDTLSWLQEQLQAKPLMPSFLLLHEPVCPPAFLDAPKIRSLLDIHPQVLAVFSGHLHLDLELSSGRHWKQFCCPAIGRSHRPAFKWLTFSRERILLNSYEWQADRQQFVQAGKWQKIEVSETLRAGLPAVRPEKGFVMQKIKEMPPRPRQENASLGQRYAELSNLNMAFMLEMTLGKMFSGN